MLRTRRRVTGVHCRSSLGGCDLLDALPLLHAGQSGSSQQPAQHTVEVIEPVHTPEKPASHVQMHSLEGLPQSL